MDPLGTTYKKTIFELADPMTAISLDFAMGEYHRNKTKVIHILNQIIKEEVSQTVMEKVAKYLNITYKNPTNVILTDVLNNVAIPSPISLPETSTSKSTVCSTKSSSSTIKTNFKSHILININQKNKEAVMITNYPAIVTFRPVTVTTYKSHVKYNISKKIEIRVRSRENKITATTYLPKKSTYKSSIKIYPKFKNDITKTAEIKIGKPFLKSGLQT